MVWYGMVWWSENQLPLEDRNAECPAMHGTI